MRPDIAAIREKHKPAPDHSWWPGLPKYCDYCHEAYHEPVTWPCDAILLCDELDRIAAAADEGLG